VVVGDTDNTPPPPAQPASGASAPAAGASAPTAGASAPAAAAAARNRSLLPTGVRLQIDLPEGRITRDVLLPPTP
jgi:hypothetical protein